MDYSPAGELKTTTKCQSQFILPELHDNRMIAWDLHVTQNLGAYDMILGRDLLRDLGITLNFSEDTIEWDHASIPLKDRDASVLDSYFVQDPSSIEDATERLKNILDAKYEKADLKKVAFTDNGHLEEHQSEKLLELFEKYEGLFDGTLGVWSDVDYNIELRDDAKPYHAKAYPIPKVHLDTLKLEVERLCKIGVLKRVNRSEWAAPTFIIPKKDGSVRFISDFRELNKRIKRKPYPIPKIQDLMLKLEGFQYATSLDLNMGYYHIQLNPASRKLCTIVLPFGKFEYQRLPMGLSNSPDIFQEKMMDIMQDLEYVRAYIDDLLCITTGSFEDHLLKLEEIFKRLQKAGLKVNANKSFFARGELEYLGYWITREGIQPVQKKIAAIQNIAEPKNKKELRAFIGIVNYYRDMWVRRSHLLAPLARLTSKTVKWQWGDKERQSFNDMKRVISAETLLAYPNFNEEFVIHTDASHYQLGAVISQKGKPIAFYSRKLKPEQTRYTTTERELLSIVETLKEFRNILLGQKIVVHTDHKNLTCKNFNTERVMRWRLILEEYGPELRYIKGEHNIVADALSRLDLKDDETQESNSLELFADDVKDFPTDFCLSYKEIEYRQRKDAYLQKKLKDKDTPYKLKTIGFGDKSYDLITWKDRIALPKALQKKAVQWYHQTLCHPGETRTRLTMEQHYYWKGMNNTVVDVCSKCPTCQLTKKSSQKLGHLPPKKAEVIPWETLCIDLIGEYSIDTKVATTDSKGQPKTINKTLTLHCLTMIDPATGWFEIVEVPNKRADVIANILEQTWLSRYPWPTQVVMDRGREFMGETKAMIKNDYGITRKPITTRNPQANAMVERAHQTVHNMIRTMRVHDQELDEQNPFGGILAAVGLAMRATVHTTTRATPSQLVFSRDAIHNIGFRADWNYIKERKQRLIDQNNKRENAKRKPHEWSVGDLVRIEQDTNRKHGQDQYKGPFEITAVYDNGTVELRQDTPNGGAVTSTWNIRKLLPYKD